MSADRTYIWRDKFDANQFWLGIKTSSGYCGWIPVFIDAFLDCFGADAYEQIKSIKSGDDPVPIVIDLRLK